MVFQSIINKTNPPPQPVVNPPPPSNQIIDVTKGFTHFHPSRSYVNYYIWKKLPKFFLIQNEDLITNVKRFINIIITNLITNSITI